MSILDSVVQACISVVIANKQNQFLVKKKNRDRLNVESSDIVWIVNKRKKSERNSPIDCRISAPQRFSLTRWRILQQRQYLAHFQDSLSMDCYNSMLRTFTILFHRIVRFNRISSSRIRHLSILTLISRALRQHSLSLHCQYLLNLYDSLSFNFYVSISRTFRIRFQEIVMLVSCGLLGFFFIGLFISSDS